MIYNTGETSDELREKYNADGSILRKAQLRMLDMMIYLDSVCQKLHINYSIDSGTVLGAVRHGGFIPWDDDVDVIIPRSDYNRLCKYLLEHPHHQFVLQCPQTDKYFYNHWNVLRDLKSEYIQNSKIHNIRKYRGMQIDLFPLDDGVIKFLYRFNQKITRCVQRFAMLNWYRTSKLLWCTQHYVIAPMCRLISHIWGDKNNVMYGYGLPFEYCKLKKNMIFPTNKISFENYSFPAPCALELYLKSIYGDYMSLPPVDKRDHHKAQYKIWD